LEKCSKASEREVRDWVAAFERDEPLYGQFPLTLANGRSIPGLHVVCSECNCRISGDRVRGRVVQSLHNVITVTANAMCTRCDRITHVDCRVRSDEQTAVLEWLANGRWQARPMQPGSIRERVTDAVRRLLAWLSSRSH
jgi:hypothetical protein